MEMPATGSGSFKHPPPQCSPAKRAAPAGTGQAQPAAPSAQVHYQVQPATGGPAPKAPPPVLLVTGDIAPGARAEHAEWSEGIRGRLARLRERLAAIGRATDAVRLRWGLDRAGEAGGQRDAPAPVRCLEEVDVGGPLGAELAQVWWGREHIEEAGGAVEAVQTETLELRADGTFRHSVAHRFAFEGGGAQRCSAEDISCAGLWRLFKVRYAGPDSDGPVHRELSFTRAEDSPPLLVERLLVSGDSSGLSEFGGAACRLRPEQEDLDMENKIRARHGHGKRHRSYYDLPFVSVPTHQLQKKQQEMLQKQQVLQGIASVH